MQIPDFYYVNHEIADFIATFSVKYQDFQINKNLIWNFL